MAQSKQHKKIITISELNDRGFEIHTDPTIIVGEMGYDEFENWIKNEPLFILDNLLNILIEFSMFEYAAITKNVINNKNNIYAQIRITRQSDNKQT